MHNEGWSIRSLCRHFGTSRNAVRRILRAHEKQRDEGHDILAKRLKRVSKLDAFEPEMHKILEKYPKITAVRLHEKLVEEGFTGGM
jgi:transposase